MDTYLNTYGRTNLPIEICKTHMTISIKTQPYVPLEFFKYKQHGVYKTVKNHEYVRAFASQLHGMQQNCIFVAITITYKPKKKGYYNVQEIKKLFHHFYWNRFLPEHLFKSSKWLKKMKEKQPLLILFPEQHEMKARLEAVQEGRKRYVYPDRFHHHAFMAIQPEHLDLIRGLEGLDTLQQFNEQIMNSDVKICTLDWIYYAGKDFNKNSDGMTVYGSGETFERIESWENPIVASTKSEVDSQN